MRGWTLAVAGLLACSSPPRPRLIPEIPLDARVRVTSRELGPGWHPGHLIRSTERCRIVTVATATHPEPIAVLNMGQVTRLQVSRASPPRDWWAEPADSEGWAEADLNQLRNESPQCRSHYPATPPP